MICLLWWADQGTGRGRAALWLQQQQRGAPRSPNLALLTCCKPPPAQLMMEQDQTLQSHDAALQRENEEGGLGPLSSFPRSRCSVQQGEYVSELPVDEDSLFSIWDWRSCQLEASHAISAPTRRQLAGAQSGGRVCSCSIRYVVHCTACAEQAVFSRPRCPIPLTH